jgi:2-oxoglutarate ferredoxin oxidoreductase subunit beta
MHIKELTDSIKKSLKKKGFKFIEVISPCPEIFGRRNKLGDAVDLMRTFKEISEVKPDHNPSEAEVSAKKIVVGEFLDIKKPTYGELLQEQHNKIQKKLTGG